MNLCNYNGLSSFYIQTMFVGMIIKTFLYFTFFKFFFLFGFLGLSQLLFFCSINSQLFKVQSLGLHFFNQCTMATFKYQIISNRSFFFVKVFTIIDVVSFNQGLVVCNASQIGYHYKGPCLGCWQATIYTKNCHNLIIFSTYPSFMHRSENLKNYFSLKFCNRLWFIFQSSIML